MLSGVERGSINQVWDVVGRMLEPNLSEQDTIDNVHERLLEGTLQLVINIDETTHYPNAACVTEVIDTPVGKKVNICYCAGKDRRKWLDSLDKMEAWAEKQGCVSVMISHARPGWKPELSAKGYVVKAILLEKALPNG